MKLVNGWRYLFKDTDRFNIELRLRVVTVFRLYADLSNREFSVTLLNFRIEF